MNQCRGHKLTRQTGSALYSGKAAIYEKLLTAIVEREGDGYIALCLEVDVVSQGDTVTEDRNNLAEALTGFFEVAPEAEVDRRPRSEAYVTSIEVDVGWTSGPFGPGSLPNS